jgi:hypothetical protein
LNKLILSWPVFYLINHFFDGFPEMINIPITESEIICTIASLKNKGSYGYDGISSKLLKKCSDLISTPLAFVFNISNFRYIPRPFEVFHCQTFIQKH